MTTSMPGGRQGGPDPSMGAASRRASWATALLVGAIVVAAMVATHRIVAIDDAFITYRYAANLARSGEVVFNLGERVEGATNLLWILVLAGLRRVTGAPIETIAIAADLVLVGVAVARCQMLLRRLGLGLRDSLLVVVATFGLSDVFLAMTNGLEAALYAALLSEALVALQRGRAMVLGVLVGLLFMTRPEGAVMGAVLVAGLATGGGGGRPLLRAALPALAIVGGTTLWRALYFGALVPNSIVAKSFPLAALPGVLTTMSLPYLGSFVAADPALVLILAASAAVLVPRMVRRRPPPGQETGLVGLWIAATAIPAASLAIAARNGGDWMPHFRLLTQYAPCYALGLGLLGRQSWFGPCPPASPDGDESQDRRAPAWSRPALLAAVTALALWPAARGLLAGTCCGIDIRTEPPAGIFTAAADRLAPILRSDDVVSAEAAGLLPYRLLSTRIHDPIGLMDPFIARHGTPAIPYGKTDIPYTFDEVRPAFMVWHWAGHVFQASAAARARYVAFCAARCDQRDDAAVVLVRRDRLDGAVADAFRTWTPWPSIDAAAAAGAPDADRR